MRPRWNSLPLLLFLIAACEQGEPGTSPGLDQEAERLMRDMSTLLGGAERFSFAATELRDVVDPAGVTTQQTIEHRTYLERPNRVRREIDRGDESALVVFNGGELGVHTSRQDFYALAEIPGEIDPALDYLAEQLDVRAPIADLLYSSPYESYVDDSTSGRYVGEETVEGSTCHHLAFQHVAIDFDLWLMDGDQALPCKLVLTYKRDEGAPSSVVTFRDWDLSPEFGPELFAYQAPEGYTRIPFLGLEGDTAATPDTTDETGR